MTYRAYETADPTNDNEKGFHLKLYGVLVCRTSCSTCSDLSQHMPHVRIYHAADISTEDTIESKEFSYLAAWPNPYADIEIHKSFLCPSIICN